MGAVTRWFAPELPEARIAVLRSVIAVFVLLDVHLMVTDPPSLSLHPDLYRPLTVAGWLHLPAPSPALAWALYAVIWVSALLGIANRLPRLAGWTLAAAFTWWLTIGFSYGKVDHDHLALVVAVWLLPTVGPVAGRWRSSTTSVAAGWVLRCIQIAVVSTYVLSALNKIRNGDWSYRTWPESAILTWAIVRRPHQLGLWLLPHPELLRGMQWLSIIAETCSPVILWLRGRALLAAAVFWLGFHAFTFALLGIHFLPTVVCWLAFAPLERLAPWWRGRRLRRRARRRGTAEPNPVEVPVGGAARMGP